MISDRTIKKRLLKRCPYILKSNGRFDHLKEYQAYADHETKEIVLTPRCKNGISMLAHEVMHARRPDLSRTSKVKAEIFSFVYELHILWKYRKIEQLQYAIQELEFLHEQFLYNENSSFNYYSKAIEKIKKSNLWKRCEKMVETHD